MPTNTSLTHDDWVNALYGGDLKTAKAGVAADFDLDATYKAPWNPAKKNTPLRWAIDRGRTKAKAQAAVVQALLA